MQISPGDDALVRVVTLVATLNLAYFWILFAGLALIPVESVIRRSRR